MPFLLICCARIIAETYLQPWWPGANFPPAYKYPYTHRRPPPHTSHLPSPPPHVRNVHDHSHKTAAQSPRVSESLFNEYPIEPQHLVRQDDALV